MQCRLQLHRWQLCGYAEGAGWVPVAELACTVDDDGLFNLQPAMFKDIWQWVDEDDVAGAVLLVSRQRQNTMVVPDALTYNGRRISLSLQSAREYWTSSLRDWRGHEILPIALIDGLRGRPIAHVLDRNRSHYRGPQSAGGG